VGVGEKVELMRRLIGIFNERGLPAISEHWTPDIVWHTEPHVPEPGVYEGKAAVSAYLQGWIGAFGDSFRLEIHEIVDLGGDDVLVVTTAHGHPLGETERETQFLDWTFINTLREEKIAVYRSSDEKRWSLYPGKHRERYCRVMPGSCAVPLTPSTPRTWRPL
jgi:SnoaL-like domain